MSSSPLRAVVRSGELAILEGGHVGLGSKRKECLAAMKAANEVGREGYPSGFGPSYERKLGASALLLRDSWQLSLLPCRTVLPGPCQGWRKPHFGKVREAYWEQREAVSTSPLSHG